MSFGDDFGGIYAQLGLVALLATVFFAWRHGGKAERLGALLAMAGWIGAHLASYANNAVPFLSDALDATGFLLVAIRYSSLWLGPTMLSYSGDFALHAMKFGQVELPPWHGMIVYALLNTVCGYLVLTAILGGTLAAMHKRRAPLTAEPRRPAKYA